MEAELKKLKSEFESRKGRISFKFMWMKLGHEDWRKKLELEPTGRQLRVLRVGRRNKWINHQGGYSYAAAQDLIEKILGGDARSHALR